jgi:hypothetical protein
MPSDIDNLAERLARVEAKQDYLAEILERVEARVDDDVGSMEDDFARLTRQHRTLWTIYRGGKWLMVVSASAGVLGIILQL